MRLSHSAIEKYNLCGEKYKLHYVEGYRDNTLGSALFFGSAWGDAVQEMVFQKKDRQYAVDKFLKSMEVVDINGTMVEIARSERAYYFKNDYDESVLTEEDDELIDEFISELNVQTTFPEELFIKRKENKIMEDEIKILNYQCWLSLRRKGILLIDAYIKDVLPKIKKVYCIEKPVNMKTTDGKHNFIGFIDMICDFEVEPGNVKKILFDHKTSSKKYPANSINEKFQLAAYNYIENLEFVGYIIAIKEIKKPKNGKRKNEMFGEIQVLIGQVQEDTIDKFLDLADTTLEKINNNLFEKNRDACYSFGRLCEYYQLCWKGKTDGLYKKEKS